MTARIGAWIELNFWKLAVGVLSQARPMSHRLLRTQEILESRPAVQFLPRGWTLPGAGWAIGFVAGLWLASIWF